MALVSPSLVGLAAAFGLTTGTAQALLAKPMVDKIAAEISAERIEKTIRKLVSFGTRNTLLDTVSDTRGIGAARRWIKSRIGGLCQS